MPRARPLPPDLRRALLLDAARSCFGREGYHGTSVADVLAEAGVARGTFYNYFDSKRAVYQAVLEDLMEEVARAARPIDVAGDIPAQTRANIARVVRVVVRPTVSRLLFADAISVDEQADAALRSFYAAALGRIAGALGMGQELGIVREGDPALVARCVLGVVKEPVFQAALAGEELEVESVVDEVFRFISLGVLRSPGP